MTPYRLRAGTLLLVFASGWLACDSDVEREPLARDGGEGPGGDAGGPEQAADDASRVEDAESGSCDPVMQDCPAAEKCTIVDHEGPNMLACSALDGQLVEGEPCRRGPRGFGDDDCAPGLFCSFIGELGPAQGGTRRCHRLCEVDAHCPRGERCGILLDEPRRAGFCGPSCEPFAACGAGLTCGDLYSGEGGALDLWLACRPLGPARSGDPCASAYECPADHVCADTGICAALCDAAHPCSSGSCQVLGAAGRCL